MNKKLINWVIVLLIVGGLGYWLFREVTKPLPGEFIGDMGREHITDISEIKYNSNPPTSGPHFPMWAKPGVYSQLIADGYFIHSMEHGYIIIWYNCGGGTPVPLATASESKPLTKMTAQATDTVGWITPTTMPTEEVKLPETFNSESCKSLVKDLTEFTKVADRIVVAPRLDMETPIALTAWRRIQKFESINKEAFTNFINTYHNHGPEQTME